MKRAILLGLLAVGLAACGGGTTNTSGGGGGTSTQTGGGGTSATATGGTGTGATSTGGTGTSGSNTGASAGTGTGATAGTGGTTTTTATDCGPCDWQCCGDQCVNQGNDIKNCGGCGITCPGPNPYCDNGVCGKPPCNDPNGCADANLCCGSACCAAGELCCMVPGPVVMLDPVCTQPDEHGSCPPGCNSCVH